MTIYIDSDYKCHVSDDGTRRAFDVPFSTASVRSLLRDTPIEEIYNSDLEVIG